MIYFVFLWFASQENERITEPDPFWNATCDKFMEQLRTGDSLKKRGRKRKSLEMSKPEDLEDSSKESTARVHETEIKLEDIKKEIIDIDPPSSTTSDIVECNKVVKKPSAKEATEMIAESKVKVENDTEDGIVKNSEDDSDEVPLIKRAARKKVKKGESDGEEEIICRKRRVRRGSRIKLETTSGSDSSSNDDDDGDGDDDIDDDIDDDDNDGDDDDEDDDSEGSASSVGSTDLDHGSSVAHRLRARKRSGTKTTLENEGMKLRSRDATPQKAKHEKETKLSPIKGNPAHKPKPKPLFGDGSDFRPGWEAEVYVYKKSLRMPPRLITVSKPSRFHRLSTSLPDLDPGSPALSVSMDSSDVCLDAESSYSFSVAGLCSGSSKIDDEEATSSTTVSCPPKTTGRQSNSIVDLLARKVGTSKKEQKKKMKEKQELKSASKILPKGTNEPELLPTPSLTPLLSGASTTIKGNKAIKGIKGRKIAVKNSKLSKPINVTDSYLLGYFRKETVSNFRDTFKNNHALPNEFSTFVLKSRTRTETRVLKKQATIREVFGEERPASAPPMQNHAGDTSQDDDSQTETPENLLGRTRKLKHKVVSRLRNAGIMTSHKAIANSKRHLLTAAKSKDSIESLAVNKLETTNKKVSEDQDEQRQENGGEEEEEEEEQEEQEEEDEEEPEEEEEEEEEEINEPQVQNNDDPGLPIKKKLKIRTGRRKFRSGFDYIRKKKKPLKKDEAMAKERKRVSRSWDSLHSSFFSTLDYNNI